MGATLNNIWIGVPAGASLSVAANKGPLGMASAIVFASGADGQSFDSLTNTANTIPLVAGEVYVISWEATANQDNYGETGSSGVTISVLNADSSVNGTTFTTSFSTSSPEGESQFGMLLVTTAAAASSTQQNDTLHSWIGPENASKLAVGGSATGSGTAQETTITLYSSGGDGNVLTFGSDQKLWAGNAYVVFLDTNMTTGTVDLSMSDRTGAALGVAFSYQFAPNATYNGVDVPLAVIVMEQTTSS